MSVDSPRTPAPAPEAGKEGEDEPKQTDEERILEEIATQKELIHTFSGDTSDENLLCRVPHEKKLGRLEFQYQNLVEEKRLARAFSIFEERYGALYSEPCLLCLDEIHVHAAEKLIQVFSCCGGLVCVTCALGINESGVSLGKCPLCRESLARTTPAERAAKLIILAERGVTWAQSNVGSSMRRGVDGFQKDEEGGLEWLNKAAAQNHPAALHTLSALHRDGRAPLLVNSEEKANELLLKAANLGYASANALLAHFYCRGFNGFEEDPDEAYFRASVAFVLDGQSHRATKALGSFHYFEMIPELEPSLYLACYYLNIAANEDDDGAPCYFYSHALQTLSEHLHDGNIGIPGSDVVPAMLFWLRKSRDLGYSPALDKLQKWESYEQSHCACCSKEAKTGEKLKQCSTCKAQWYCSKECQVKAWKSGHRNDCKRARILKFEDYLNSE